MNLTRYEQEVVINFNADEEMATVYSANPAWIRKWMRWCVSFLIFFMLNVGKKLARWSCKKMLLKYKR